MNTTNAIIDPAIVLDSETMMADLARAKAAAAVPRDENRKRPHEDDENAPGPSSKRTKKNSPGPLANTTKTKTKPQGNNTQVGKPAKGSRAKQSPEDIAYREFFNKNPRADVDERRMEAERLGIEWKVARVRWSNWRRKAGIAEKRPGQSPEDIAYREFFNKNPRADEGERRKEAERLGIEWKVAMGRWNDWRKVAGIAEKRSPEDIAFHEFFNKNPRADEGERRKEAERLGIEWKVAMGRWNDWRRRCGITEKRPEKSPEDIAYREFFNKNPRADEGERRKEAERLGIDWQVARERWKNWRKKAGITDKRPERSAEDIAYQEFFIKNPRADVDERRNEAFRLGMDWHVAIYRWNKWRTAAGMAETGVIPTDPEKLAILDAAFESNRYPSDKARYELVRDAGLGSIRDLTKYNKVKRLGTL
ncbi:hypothetical protein BDZ89DRAFT_133549 [Hymenopellis radicata]|nr:hypothetical protein BDZ89DRAFT_133549 [Hymenopellis radicata]